MTAAKTQQALGSIRAFLLDLDGVITPTAEVHERAWADLFTRVFEEHGAAPYTDADYFSYLDGKPRFVGVRDALASRGIALPEGMPGDDPEFDTVCGLGNRKNAIFARLLDEEGVTAYPGSLELVAEADALGIETAVVTSSRNGHRVLRAAGLEGRFETIVDGVRAAELELPGKPAPDTYLQGARELDLPASACAVVEDALSGVAAGAAGGFGLVIGVDRGAGVDELLEAGADIVVADLADLVRPLHEARSSAG